MTLTLTDSQRATVADAMQPGAVLLARITREQFTGGNAETSGQLQIEFVAVSDAAIAELRSIVRKHQL